MPVGRLLLRDRAVPQILEHYVKFLLIDDQSGRSMLVAVKQVVADQTELCLAPF
jgi:hypothetical protein